MTDIKTTEKSAEDKKTATKLEVKKEEITWAGMVDHFLKTPPTESIFRLYLLSFVLWNKGVLMYILFGDIDMADKLAFSNWGQYLVFGSGNIWCGSFWLYIGPVIISLGIYNTVFYKLKWLEGVSLYDYLFIKHHEAESKRLTEEIGVEKKKQEVAEEKLETINIQKKTKEEIYKNAPVPEDPKWKEDYEFFKKGEYFKFFKAVITRYHYTQKSFKRWVVLEAMFDYLKNEQCLKFEAHNSSYSFNVKGEYFIKMYEFEESNDFIRVSQVGIPISYR